MNTAHASTPYGLAALGIVNALGFDGASVLANLLAGEAPGLARRGGWIPGREIFVGEVNSPLPPWPEPLGEHHSRNNRLLLAAYEQIAESTEAALARFGRDRIGVVIGSSTSGILEGERAAAAWARGEPSPPGYHYRQQEIGDPARALAAYLGLESIAYTISAACSSSAKAFASARNLLDLDLCDAVLVGGVDSLCGLTLNGFLALESLARDRCNPFAAGRDGIVIGEGAALFLLTREAAPIALFGVGESTDAYHISAPHPEGEGAEAAMRAALFDAGLTADTIDYINLHGTATPKNDAMESLAVARLFGAKVACSSTKSLTGHTLGAAGATEVALCWLLLSALNRHGILPAQNMRGDVDPDLAPIGLLTRDATIGVGARYCLSNSFAFGGSNCAVVIGRAAETGHD